MKFSCFVDSDDDITVKVERKSKYENINGKISLISTQGPDEAIIYLTKDDAYRLGIELQILAQREEESNA